MRAACWAETKPRLEWPALRRLAIAFIVPQFAFLWESRAVPQGTGAEGVRGTRVVSCGLRQGGFALPSHPRGEPSPARPVANAALDYSLSVPVILQAARRATPPRPASSPSGLSTYGLIPVVTALSRRAHRMLPTVASVLRGLPALFSKRLPGHPPRPGRNGPPAVPLSGAASGAPGRPGGPAECEWPRVRTAPGPSNGSPRRLGVRDEPSEHRVSEGRLGREGGPGRPPCHPGQQALAAPVIRRSPGIPPAPWPERSQPREGRGASVPQAWLILVVLP